MAKKTLEPSNGKSAGEWVRLVVELLGAVTAIVGPALAAWFFLKDWVRNQETNVQWYLAIGVLAVVWAAALVVRFVCRKALTGECSKHKVGRVVIICLAAGIPLLVGGLYYGRYLQKARSSDTIKVVVAEFDGDKEEANKFRRIVLDRLDRRFGNDSKVRFVSTSDKIKAGDGYKKVCSVGEKTLADVVIAGMAEKDEKGAYASVRCYLLQRVPIAVGKSKRNAGEGVFEPDRLIFEVDELLTAQSDPTTPFEVYIRGADRVVSQLSLIEGLIHYAGRDWKQADDSFASALEAMPSAANSDRRGQGGSPAELRALIHFYRGNAYLNDRRPRDAIDQYTDAIETAREEASAANNQREGSGTDRAGRGFTNLMPLAYYNRAIAKTQCLRITSATDDFWKAFDLGFPTPSDVSMETYYTIAKEYLDSDQIEAARNEALSAIKGYKTLKDLKGRETPEHARGLSRIHAILGDVFRRLGRLDDANVALTQAIDKFRGIPGNWEGDEGLARAYRNRGEVLHQKVQHARKLTDKAKGWSNARKDFKKAKEIWRVLTAAIPSPQKKAEYRMEVTGEVMRIANTCFDEYIEEHVEQLSEKRTAALNESIMYYRQCMSAREEVLSELTGDRSGVWQGAPDQFRAQIADSYAHLAKALCEMEKISDPKEANSLLKKAIEIYKQLIEQSTAGTSRKEAAEVKCPYRDDLAWCYMLQAIAEVMLDGNLEKADEAFREAEAQLKVLLKKEKKVEFEQLAAYAHFRYGRALIAKGRRDANTHLKSNGLTHLEEAGKQYTRLVLQEGKRSLAGYLRRVYRLYDKEADRDPKCLASGRQLRVQMQALELVDQPDKRDAVKGVREELDRLLKGWKETTSP